MASANVTTFTTDNWEQEVVNSNQLVVVDFWAPWCGPCRALSPTIDKLAARYAGKVKVGKLNVDEAPEVAVQFGVNSIPRVLFFKGSNKPVREFTGVASEQTLANAITQALEE
jgi:thioredoxin 1